MITLTTTTTTTGMDITARTTTISVDPYPPGFCSLTGRIDKFSGKREDDGRRYPIAYASRQTNVVESSYAPTELEVAAIVYAVEHFEVYLLGSDFTVYADHKSLVSAFLATKRPNQGGY